MHFDLLRTPRWNLAIACSLILAGGFGGFVSPAGQFEDLGIPVKGTMVNGTAAGVDENGEDVFYFSCSQPGNHLFLLQVNPRTDLARQWSAPIGEGAWAITVGPDNCVYLGTWESGYLLRFDPKHPANGLENLGKPCATETYIWDLACGSDGRIYGCTYPHAKLMRYDPKTKVSEDLGRMDPKEMYGRWIAASTNGFLYAAIGTVRGQVVRIDPATARTKPMFDEASRPAGTPHVFANANGQVFASAANKAYECDGEVLRPVNALSHEGRPTLRDGTVLGTLSVEPGTIAYEVRDTAGHTARKSARFSGIGIRVFAVGAGPAGRIFGSTALPLEMFDYSPASGELRDLGNPTDVGGEIYSFATDGRLLYLCAYPQSFLSIYDAAKPWHYGRAKDSNPRGFGYMGDGHLRPRAMVSGPDGRVYVGSLPPYGQAGGALGIYDPTLDSVAENYRHIVTNQGISALSFDAETGRLFAGSSIDVGGGAVPVAKECVVFAWDTKGRRKLWEQILVKRDTTVSALAAAGGKVFGVSLPSNTLFVLDAEKLEVLSRVTIPFGRLHEISLGYYQPHKRIYGLAGQSIFAVDPDTFALTELGRSDSPITCGFAVTDTGIYFGSDTHLRRWRWD